MATTSVEKLIIILKMMLVKSCFVIYGFKNGWQLEMLTVCVLLIFRELLSEI